MRQYLVLEDDIQSIDDEEYHSREPGDTDDLVEMESQHRLQEAFDRPKGYKEDSEEQRKN
eukprot:3980270-Amphidinium_carterae.1